MRRFNSDYQLIVNDIIDLYIDYDIKEFPVDLKELCNRLGVSVIPYSKFPSSEHALLCKSGLGRFIRQSKTTPPTIIVDDIHQSNGACRFTIAHEIKHYIYDENSSDSERDDFADFFARYLLAPIPYLIVKGITTDEEIASHCGITVSAAANARKNIESRMQIYGSQIFKEEREFLKHLIPDEYEFYEEIHYSEMLGGWLI